jgi:hypothetical protein
VELEEIRDGLVYWLAPHPEWEADAEPGSAADWPELVGSTFYDAGETAVFIDPLVPEDGWEQIDALVAGRAVSVLTTLRWHGRSRDALLSRYGARLETTAPGVEPRPVPRFGETEFWIPAHGALVVGDRLLGDDQGGLRLCPDSWLTYLDGDLRQAELAAALRPLLELPIELVLTSHGAPVLADGHAALEQALS